MRWLLVTVSLPFGAPIGWGGVLLACAFGLAKDIRWEYPAVLTAEWRSWFTKFYRYSVTFGRAVIYQPEARDDLPEVSTRTERHEHIHIRQIEDALCKSLLIGITIGLSTGNWHLAWWIYFSGGVWLLINYITSTLRFGIKNAYRDAEHERSAYSQVEIGPNGTSWLERHNNARK